MNRKVCKAACFLLIFCLEISSIGCGIGGSKSNECLLPELLARSVGSTIDEVATLLDQNGLAMNADELSYSEYIMTTVIDKKEKQDAVVNLYGVTVKVQLHFTQQGDNWYFVGEVYYQRYARNDMEQAVKNYGAIVENLPFKSEPKTDKNHPNRYFNNASGLTPLEVFEKGGVFREGWEIQNEEDFTCVKPFLEKMVTDPQLPYHIYICSAIMEYNPVRDDFDMRIRIWPMGLRSEDESFVL